MMCSTWKISVFGIVALMLAFGLVAGDAFAHSDGHSSHPSAPRAVNHFDDATLTVTVTSTTADVEDEDGVLLNNGYGGGQFTRTNENLLDPLEDSEDPKLRAAEILDNIVFTYSPGETNSKGTIVLTIPGGWTKPIQDNDDNVHEPGEIEVSGDRKFTIGSAGGGGWRVTSNRDPEPAGPIAITYKRVTVPKSANNYDFGFASNVVGPGHTSVLDGHLLSHAKGVTEGDHYHRDIGLSVESHTHTDSGIEGTSFTIAVHTHAEDGITPIIAHTHRYTESTTDDDDLTEVHDSKNHAHDGDDEGVVKVYGHTHDGHGDPAVVGLAHDHAGDKKDVSIAPLHSHGGEASSVSSIVFHDHSPSSADNATIPIHSHPALVEGAPQKNLKILDHAHLGEADVFDATQDSSSAVAEHEHSGLGKDITGVPAHYHASATSDGAAVLEDVNIGPDHEHTNVEGGRPLVVPSHKHKATVTDTTGAPLKDTIETHTHLKAGDADSDTSRRTAAQAGTTIMGRHVHSSPIGGVPSLDFHTHLDAGNPAGDPLHTHDDSTSQAVEHAIDSHTHEANAAVSIILHNHVFHKLNGYSIRLDLPKSHRHADSAPDDDAVDTPEADGAPLHTHTVTDEVLKGRGGPYAVLHAHNAADANTNPNVGGGAVANAAPLHMHEADDDVIVVSQHTHAAAATDFPTGASSGKYAHTHDEDASTDSPNISLASIHKHDTKTMGGAPYHTHPSGKIVTAAEHNHGGTVTETSAFDTDGELPRHTHDLDDDGVAMPPEAHPDEHKHASVGAHSGDPIHNHTADYDNVAGEDDTHVHDFHETVAGPIFHSHTDGYGSLVSTASHKHDTAATGAGSPLHSHIEDFTEVDFAETHEHSPDDDGISQIDGHDHAHVKAIGGAISVPRAHAHPDIAGSSNHVDQGDSHFHAYDDGSYIVGVGSAYSGSGMLEFTNTATPRLAPEVAEDSPYKGEYLVTKGQSLGDLILTYTAAGTMVKGAAIRISTDLPIDQGFYPYNRGGGPGGAVTLDSGSAKFAADPDGDADGVTEDSLYVETTRAIEAGNSIVFRVRNLNIKAHGKEVDGNDPTLIVANYTLGASSASPLATPTVPYDSVDLISVSVEESPTITVTAAHKTGSIKLQGRDPLEDLGFATAGEVLNTLAFTYTAGVPMAIGSQVEIEIPKGWPVPFEATSASDDRAGAVVLTGTGGADLSIDGMVLKATAMVALEGDPAPTLVFEYKMITAPLTQNSYSFVTRTNAGPHARGNLEALDPIMVDVTGTHGAGTIALKRGGTVLRQVTKNQPLGNLQFVYEAEGRMAIGAQVQITIPAGWTSPHIETTDGTDSAGEVSIGSGNADLELAGGGGRPWKLTAATTAALSAGDTIEFNYKKVTAPGTSGSDTFTTHATSFTGAFQLGDIGARLKSSPTVGIDQAPDGAGTVAVTSTAIDGLEQDSVGAYLVGAGEPLGNLVFTYTSTGSMESGSAVTLTIPGTDADWPNPTPDDEGGAATAGEVAVGGAGVVAAPSIDDRTITVDISADLVSGNTFTITYKKVNAPTTVKQYDFIVQSKSTTGGELTNLSAGSPTIKVGAVQVGELTITKSVDGVDTPLTTAGPGEAIGNIKLTFTATSRMASGSQVIIGIPDGWSPPSEDNGDTTDDEGEVALASGTATHEVRGGKIVATANADLASDDMLVFTYKGVVAQATPGSASFTTEASISTTGTPVAIAEQPTPITVREMVTAIAIEADDSFFAGESLSGMVTLWGGTAAAANALGDMVVTLSSDSETGSFAADSITIADNMPGAPFTYNDTAPGMVILTATSGTLTATADVTVKSGVAGLSVTPDLVKAGSDVTVTATGKAGGGTVKVMDSESMQVGVTKSLDPVLEPEDGDVTYSRTITLPADLADGTYTVTVDIQGLMDSMDIEVLNNQAPPMLSDATARPMTVVNGDIVTLVVKATSTIAGDISVMADVGMVDSTKTADIPLTELTGATGTYTTIFTISDINTADDGEATITITATDRILNSSMTTVTVTLDNVSDDELTRVWVEPTTPYKPGATAWIKAMGTAGGEASATVNNSESGMMIAQVALEEMEGTPGTYVGGLTVVEDAHPVGTYDVTVTLGNAEAMTVEDALTIEAAGYTFTLSIPAGTHLVHVPLDVTHINGVEGTIGTVGDLYDALGTAVNFIISLGADGNWNSYLGDSSAGTTADAAIGDDTGLIAVMSGAATLVLDGEALGTGGVATITLGAGNNLVGLPLDSAQISTISGVVASPLVSAVVVSNMAGDGFDTIAQPGDPGDGAPMGGQGYIVVAAAAASIPVIGAPWQDSAMMADIMMADMNGGMAANGNGAAAAPSIGFRTPVLQVQGKLIDDTGMMSREGLNVTVKNLSSGVVLGRSTATDTYSMTFVKLDDSAAKIGDVLEIRADSPSTLVGIRPVQHVVTSEDVLNSRISLPDLVTYEIPAQTELLANYPNPFNPETWVPFRLAEDGNVSLSIYGASGSLVRTIDVGFTPAAVYEGRSDAIYWDGRNNFGEQVSSGIYFYHLNAGDFSATRKMVIVK